MMPASDAVRCLLAALLAHAFAVMPGACGDTVELRSAIRIPAGRQEILLSDIATLAGAEAERLGGVVIVRDVDPSQLREITLEVIRTAMEEAGVPWSQVHLSGGDVLLRPRPGATAAVPLAMQGVSIAASESEPEDVRSVAVSHRVRDLLTEPTLRAEVAMRIVAGLGREPDDVELTFDPHDVHVLATPLADWRFEIVPLSGFDSDRIELAVRFWRGSEVVKSESLSVEPRVRVRLLTVARDMERDQSLTAADVMEQETWLPPSQARLLAKSESTLGRVASRSLRAGATLRARDVRNDVLVKRGDRVVVRCLSGGIVITLQAEARGDGAMGDAIELRKVGERDTFIAVVSGSGEAILDLGR